MQTTETENKFARHPESVIVAYYDDAGKMKCPSMIHTVSVDVFLSTAKMDIVAKQLRRKFHVVTGENGVSFKTLNQRIGNLEITYMEDDGAV